MKQTVLVTGSERGIERVYNIENIAYLEYTSRQNGINYDAYIVLNNGTRIWIDSSEYRTIKQAMIQRNVVEEI